MTKLLTIILTIAAVCAFPATANAQDETPACHDTYVLVQSAGGPLCVNPIYLEPGWEDDPATCEHGYYQGSCAPAPAEPEVFEPEAYTYQQIPTPVAEVEVVPVVVYADAVCLIQRPC